MPVHLGLNKSFCLLKGQYIVAQLKKKYTYKVQFGEQIQRDVKGFLVFHSIGGILISSVQTTQQDFLKKKKMFQSFQHSKTLYFPDTLYLFGCLQFSG